MFVKKKQKLGCYQYTHWLPPPSQSRLTTHSFFGTRFNYSFFGILHFQRTELAPGNTYSHKFFFLWAAELMRPGFLWIYVADSQVPSSHPVSYDIFTTQNQCFRWPIWVTHLLLGSVVHIHCTTSQISCSCGCCQRKYIAYFPLTRKCLLDYFKIKKSLWWSRCRKFIYIIK